MPSASTASTPSDLGPHRRRSGSTWSPPALVATIPPTVAESRAARSTPKASRPPSAWRWRPASVTPAPAVTWPAAGRPRRAGRGGAGSAPPRRASGTEPPTRPVLPPWGTMAHAGGGRRRRTTAATSSTSPGRTTAGVEPTEAPGPVDRVPGASGRRRPARGARRRWRRGPRRARTARSAATVTPPTPHARPAPPSAPPAGWS